MNKEKVLGILRHALTFIGGVLIARGIADEIVIAELVGGISTVVGSVWSILDKK
jgi:hypothetical protein